jgi:hypothetical protein
MGNYQPELAQNQTFQEIEPSIVQFDEARVGGAPILL